MKAIPTKYKGRQMRSRLEAKWAAFFDLVEWDWEYEPCDFDGWIPDFVLYGNKMVFVEVKPIVVFDPVVADKINKSGCEEECLLVGMRPLHGSVWENMTIIGWLQERTWYEGEPTLDSWDEAPMGQWTDANKPGFCHATGSYHDRMSGKQDGGRCGGLTRRLFDFDGMIERSWAQACNVVQWNAPMLQGYDGA